jgi:hypothetical protein
MKNEKINDLKQSIMNCFYLIIKNAAELFVDVINAYGEYLTDETKGINPK